MSFVLLGFMNFEGVKVPRLGPPFDPRLPPKALRTGLPENQKKALSLRTYGTEGSRCAD